MVDIGPGGKNRPYGGGGGVSLMLNKTYNGTSNGMEYAYYGHGAVGNHSSNATDAVLNYGSTFVGYTLKPPYYFVVYTSIGGTASPNALVADIAQDLSLS